ncbi:MAG: 5-bromo-4-chloroindolyl phosphate hydrolysis family protein [Oscillospiraceae bacterium]|nr:5-bromo-4-chloroindolyl phosphate hydrolysis family protein [Oscillospiraceae bacterium]
MITVFATIFSLYITIKLSVAAIRLLSHWIRNISFFTILATILFLGSIYEGSATLFLATLLLLFLIKGLGHREKSKKEDATVTQINTVTGRDAKNDPVVPAMEPIQDDENGRILSSALQEIYSMNNLISGFRNEAIRTNGFQLCQKARTILNVLRTNPDQIANVRQFWNYYLPSTNSILRKYDRLERSNVADWETVQKVNQYLIDINAALDNLYTSLFEVDKKSLQIEMEALQLSMQREGLVSSDEVIDRNSGIRLAI